MERTREHFRELYNRAKNYGLKESIGYDIKETGRRGYVLDYTAEAGFYLACLLVTNTVITGLDSLINQRDFCDTFFSLSPLRAGVLGGLLSNTILSKLQKKEK
jgi:hypothetical protein